VLPAAQLAFACTLGLNYSLITEHILLQNSHV
jgi:hypothetical protein